MTDELVAEIRSRGHYDIVVRPAAFVIDRIPYEELWPIIQKCSVSLRGWDFPHAGTEDTLQHFDDSIRQRVDWQYYREMWRLYQSGQFAYVGGIHEDWAERSERWRPPDPPEGARGLLGGQDLVARFTEVYEFAARLAATPAGDDLMHIEVALRNLAGRQLYMEDPARHLTQTYRTDTAEFAAAETVDRAELLAEPQILARSAVRKLLLRFHFNAHETVLEQLQDNLRFR